MIAVPSSLFKNENKNLSPFWLFCVSMSFQPFEVSCIPANQLLLMLISDGICQVKMPKSRWEENLKGKL